MILSAHWGVRLCILILAHVAGTVPIVSVMAMAPVIQIDLKLSATEIGLLISGYYFAQAVTAVPAGVLVDRIGIGRSLLTSHSFLIIGTFLFSRADGLEVAIISTLLMGIGYSIINPSTSKGILIWFPIDRRATAMGFKQTGVPIAGLLAALNGALVTLVNWQNIFVMVAALIVVNGILCLTLVEPLPKNSEKSVLEIFRQMLKVSRIKNIRIIFLSNIPGNIGQMNFFSYLTLFMRDAGATQPVAGLVMGLAQISSAFGRIGWGVVSDKLGDRKRIIVYLFAASVIFMLLMPLAQFDHGLWLGAALAIGLGATIGSYPTLAHTFAAESVEPDQSGAAVGYSLTGMYVGGIVGPPIFGAVVDHTGDLSNGWIATAILIAFGAIVLGMKAREQRRVNS